jgi:hypothetical protein
MASGALALALAVSACGDDDGDEGVGVSDPAPLVDRIPTGVSELNFVDLRAVWDELGLPEDAEASLGLGDDETRLNVAAGNVLQFLSLPRRTPLHDAIDLGRVDAAASNLIIGLPGIAVLQTSQPFDEIAAALEEQGYERDGGVMSTELGDGAGSTTYNVVADDGDGLIVLGFDRDTVEASVDGKPGLENPARPLIEQVEGVSRAAIASTDSGCVRGLAIGESADGDTGEIRIEVEGEASAGRFRLPERRVLPMLEYGEAVWRATPLRSMSTSIRTRGSTPALERDP